MSSILSTRKDKTLSYAAHIAAISRQRFARRREGPARRELPLGLLRGLQDADVIFLTHDEDFLFGKPIAAVIVISRVRQSRPLKERIDVWRSAVGEFA